MAKVIAVDGPSGAGKSSVSRIVGERLGFLHVDSGALYRIITWQCLEEKVDTTNPAAIAAFAPQVEIECRPEAGRIAYYVKGEEPGNRIRTPEINAHASQVATVKEVRDRVTAILRGMTQYGDLVIEGRDITTAVFPDTPARFYLTASAEARAPASEGGGREGHCEPVRRGGEEVAPLPRRNRFDAPVRAAQEGGRGPRDRFKRPHARAGRRDRDERAARGLEVSP